jgi:hypothetical protein
VVTFGWDSGWAEVRAVDTGELATVPASVDLIAVVALPVADVSALRSLRDLGGIVGRRVLITGASGGVGGTQRWLSPTAGPACIQGRCHCWGHCLGRCDQHPAAEGF